MADTNPKDPGANAGAAAHSAAAQGQAGTGGFTSTGFEGSIKQASDIGTEEAMAVLESVVAKQAAFEAALANLNAKRTYDQAQSYDHAVQHNDVVSRQRINSIAEQALQNAVETANMVGKQAVRHGDLAIDRQWNPDEQAWSVTEIMRSNIFKEAIEAAVAAAANKK